MSQNCGLLQVLKTIENEEDESELQDLAGAWLRRCLGEGTRGVSLHHSKKKWLKIYCIYIYIIIYI